MVLEGKSRLFLKLFYRHRQNLNSDISPFFRWFYRSIPKCVLESCSLLRGHLVFPWMDSKSCTAAMAHSRLPSRNGARQITSPVLTLGKLHFSFLCKTKDRARFLTMHSVFLLSIVSIVWTCHLTRVTNS
jgi:hypothetical protein